MQKQKMSAVMREAENTWRKFIQALPVIIFFLILFYSVVYFFGMQHVMLASLVTVVFQVNYKKHPPARTLLFLIYQQFALEILAFLATLNLPFCIFLNLVIPFWMIYTKASQFNQLGYFSGLMTFTFLQLMPVGWEGIIPQMKAMAYCLCYFFVITLVYSRTHKAVLEEHMEKRGLLLLAQVLEQTVKGQDTGQEVSELFQIQRALYKEAYQKRGRRHVVTAEGKIRYMFALLFQRCVYFVSSQYREFFPEDENAREFALRIAEYMREAGNFDLWNEDTRILRLKGRKMLRETKGRKEEFYHSAENFLKMFLLILSQMHLEDYKRLDEQWKIPLIQRLKERFLYRMKLDAFEMRFALRMSIILIITMVYTMVSQADHGYWLAMNAFLLLRPMYEESRYRMKTRFIGTAAGCVLMIFLLSFCHGNASHFLLAGVMVAGMYTVTPGTKIHAVFVTCFALSMTTLAMRESLALWLRMGYVAAAVLLVLVVNQFFFPTSLGTQFRYNWKMIFHMHHMYLRLLENALTHSLDYWRVCEAQIQYSMVYDQLEQYIPKLSQEEQPTYRRILGICWRMVSEMEQMLFLVGQKHRGEQAVQKMSQYIHYTDYVLNQIQDMLHLQKEKKVKNIELTDQQRYQRYIEGEKELSVLMTQYAKNLSKLYIIVCEKYRK